MGSRERQCCSDCSVCSPDSACLARVAGDRVLSAAILGFSAGMGAGIPDCRGFVRLFCGLYTFVAGYKGSNEKPVEFDSLGGGCVSDDISVAGYGFKFDHRIATNHELIYPLF